MTTGIEVFERPVRDLAAEELWRRSLARSRKRRALLAAGIRARRSLVSAAIPDLGAPAEYIRIAASSERNLADDQVWGLSLACARAKRLAANKGFLEQARVASAPLVVAAVAALAPAQGGAHPRAGAAKAKAARIDATLLKIGSRGSRVKAVQRTLGIPADGIFGPQTRAAVRAFQTKSGLVADGIVGPRTRSALFGRRGGALIRAWWVVPVQRALGVRVGGLYGPQSRAAVRAYQARHGLTIDGIVGPQTLSHLGIARRSSRHHHHGSSASGPASISRALWDELAIAKRMGLRLISGYRPGATIAGGGGASDHARYPSRAIDVAGSPATMRQFARRTAGGLRSSTSSTRLSGSGGAGTEAGAP